MSLLSVYAKEHASRARGGLVAIAGFDFQLRCYVADFVQELARATEIHQAGAVFLEAFSDVCRAEDDCTVLVQAKRTLTKARLAEAAVEAILIDEFMERTAENIREKLCFEVVGRWGGSGLKAPTWGGVSLPKDLDQFDRRQRRFEQLLSSERLRPPRLDPDPWWRIIRGIEQVA